MTAASVLEIGLWPSRTCPLETSTSTTALMRRASRCVSLFVFLPIFFDITFDFFILPSAPRLLIFHLRP